MTDDELIRAVAEEVMGYKEDIRTLDIRGYYRNVRVWISPNEDAIPYNDFDPIDDISHAWMVVERMRELGWAFKIWSYHAGEFNVFFMNDMRNGEEFRAVDGTAGRAICLAAWEAMMGGDIS